VRQASVDIPAILIDIFAANNTKMGSDGLGVEE
jgi:hypothetical protein